MSGQLARKPRAAKAHPTCVCARAMITTAVMLDLIPVPLTPSAFANFGTVFDAPVPEDGVGPLVNEGSAVRTDFVVELENRRATAKLNVAHFRSRPRVFPRVVDQVERHPGSTQLFVPLNAEQYVVVVGKQESDGSLTLSAFLAQGTQGVAYAPGTWHHTLLAVGQETLFACFVWEDGSAGDCDLRQLSAAEQRQLRLSPSDSLAPSDSRGQCD
jgi:ureidoglycolate lyase